MTTHGAQMDRKWTGSGPEVDWMCPSVRPYVCPSQTLPLPPWRTLCEGSTIFLLGLGAGYLQLKITNLGCLKIARPETGQSIWSCHSPVLPDWLWISGLLEISNAKCFYKNILFLTEKWYSPYLFRYVMFLYTWISGKVAEILTGQNFSFFNNFADISN